MIKLGKVNVVEQIEQKEFSQEAASAWSAFGGVFGAGYKPIAYVGTQIAKGVNHVFLAEQTLSIAKVERHIVIVTVNEFMGEYTPSTISVVV